MADMPTWKINVVTWSHMFYCIFIDKVMIMFVKAAMKSNTVALKEKVLKRVDASYSYITQQHEHDENGDRKQTPY